MKRINKAVYKCAWGLSLALLINSCSLDEYNPVAVPEEVVLSKFAGWKAYQANCYSGLWGSLIGMPYGLVSEFGTDLWTFPHNNHSTYREIIAYEAFTNNMGVVTNTWDFAWGSIKDCNKTIDLSTQLTDGDENAGDIAILVAEAHFLRAYYYSVLVAQFGEVPLILEGDPEHSLTPQRSTLPELYSQILSDLRFAFNTLPVLEPYDKNPSRVTKKAAFGIMAKVYAQGAGEGLSEGGKSYWKRAKEVADSLITNQGAYGVTLYDDFGEVFASANNRNNAESVFTAYGLDPYDVSYNYATRNSNPNLYLHYYPKLDDAFGTADVFRRTVNSNGTNAYYGRLNQQIIAPTKYLLDCFDARYDKRWENTFVTAFTNYSGVQALASVGASAHAASKVTYAEATVELTAEICAKYGIDASHVGKKIYPYADVNTIESNYGAAQFIPKVWTKGAHSGAIADLEEVANANIHPYPLVADDDRFFAYLSKDPLSADEKKARAYITINIDDMFDSTDPTGSTYKGNLSNNGFTPSSLIRVWPAMMKFNHNFDGGWMGGNFQQKLGNIMVMRMAEVYLIAAEATLNSGGSATEAAAYLNVLRQRACRNAEDFNTSTGMQLATATLDDVFDEYARELCGEFNRWALLKRNKAFESRLERYNKTAFANFVPTKHYRRPIPYTFLDQINNAEEFGNNGY